MNGPTLHVLLVLAGIGQLGLAAASLAIPHLLHWSEETAKLRPLIRQVFWTYAGYIWVTNCGFGLLSALAPAWLLDRSPLAGAVAGFIAAYWGCRLLIQFVYFDRTELSAGFFIRWAEGALVALFVFLTFVYGSVLAFQVVLS